MQQKKGVAIAALVVGAIAFATGWMPVFGLISGGAAIALGIIALVKKQQTWMGVTGLSLGVAAFLTALTTTFMLFAGVMSAVEAETRPTAPTTEAPAPQPESAPEPEATPEPAPEPETKPGAIDTAAVESAFLEAFGVTSLTELLGQPGIDSSNPVYAISEWEPMGTSTMRVYVQADMTKAEAQKVGIHIFNFVGPKFPELDIIVVRGIDGIDRNVSRRDAPLANG